MLEYFMKSKEAEIALLQEQEHALAQTVWTHQRVPFAGTLRTVANRGRMAVIAEYKRASPSLGDINALVSPEDMGAMYMRAGATAISVLTEKTKFKGSMHYLQRIHTTVGGSIPLLRKDFLFHPVQILETAQTGASAVLLIVRMTPDPLVLRSLREQAESFGMDAVVEVFDAHDIALARESGAKLIQVNARDLQTLVIDRQKALALANAERFHQPQEELWIAASGMESVEHVKEASASGFDAVLVGTSLMQQEDPVAVIQTMSAVPRQCI